MAAARAAALATLLIGLAGCSSMGPLNPVEWWHDLEGGPIAAARPPPPNADAPYPSLASVPDRPQANDAAARGQIANALVADRANAQYDASIAPLSPVAPSPPPPPVVGPNTSDATLATASAPPPPVTAPAPRPAPRAPVRSTPLAPPASVPAQTEAASASPSPPIAGPPPDMPQAPPPPPVLPGVLQTTAPTPPAPTPPPPARPVRPLVAGAPAPVAFAPGSAVLPSTAYPALKALAQQRGEGAAIAVVGFGGAADTAPVAQQAAMPLALARARAIAVYLETAGVPSSALRIDAEATGQGGVARLIQ